ncbi:MAG: hypothetical protein WA510_28045 [Acidobacteriaceae bacterium]
MKKLLSLAILLLAGPLFGQAVGGGGVPGAGSGSGPFHSLTTTGTSGAATLSGGVLNVPQYTSGSSLPTAPAAGYAPVSTAPGTSSYSASPVVANLFPGNIQLTVDGASVTAGYNAENDTYILSQSGGSGYSGTGTVTVSGGTCATTPTISAVVEPNSASSTTGPLVFSQTVIGYCSSSPTSCTPTGFTGGSGASCTVSHFANPYPNPWPTLLTTESALNGKVASFTNNAVNSAVIAGVTNSVSYRFTSLGYATTCASGSYNEYFLLGGDAAQNTIYGNGGGVAGGEAAYAQWIALAHAIKAAGCKLIVTTPIPRGTSSDTNGIPTQALLAGIQTFSSLLRNGVVGVDYDFLIDHGALIQDTSDPNFFDQVDYTHPIAGGHQMMADIANAALIAGGAPHAILAPWMNPIWAGNAYVYGSTGLAGPVNATAAGTATVSPFLINGHPYSPISATVPPQVYLGCSGATEPSWDPSGVYLGFNLCSSVSTFSDIIEAHQNGGNQLFAISALGAYYGTGFSGTSANGFGWSSGTSVGSNRDTTLCRGGAAGIVSVESAATCTNTVAGATGTLAYAVQAPGIIYSAAGTAVPTCGSSTKGYNYTVSDATSPTFMGTYTSGGGITAEVICSYNGTTYSLLTH